MLLSKVIPPCWFLRQSKYWPGHTGVTQSKANPLLGLPHASRQMVMRRLAEPETALHVSASLRVSQQDANKPLICIDLPALERMLHMQQAHWPSHQGDAQSMALSGPTLNHGG
ncbi:hypothetical protein SRHO_G00317060 [Serrasalmus rhombeus]